MALTIASAGISRAMKLNRMVMMPSSPSIAVSSIHTLLRAPPAAPHASHRSPAGGTARTGLSLRLPGAGCDRQPGRDLTLGSVRGYESGGLKVKKQIPVWAVCSVT